MRLLLLQTVLTAICFGQVVLTYPSTQTGNVRAGGVVRYRLPGTPDDVITIVHGERTPRTSASSCVRVLDETGNPVLPRQCVSSTGTERFRVFRSQWHTLEVSENGDNQDLNFEISVSCAGRCSAQPGPSPITYTAGAPVTFGQAINGLLLEGERHWYTAGAPASDILTVSFQERTPTTSATLCHQVLKLADGTRLSQQCFSSGGQQQVRLPEGGLYKVEIYEREGNNPVAYQLRVSCTGTCRPTVDPLPPVDPPPPISLRFGETLQAILLANRPPDRHAFYGVENDVITVTIAERSPTTSATACAALVGPTARLVNRCGSLSATMSVRLVTTGMHTVEVTESGSDDPLAYSLTVACSGVCSPGPGSGGTAPPPAQPRLTAAPSSFLVTATAGGTSTESVPLRLIAEGFTGRYEARATEPWLSVSPSQGTLPAEPAVRLNLTGLPPGEFTASIEVTSPERSGLRFTIPVELQIVERKPAVSPGLLTLRPASAGSDSQYVLVQNPTPKPVPFEAVYSSKGSSARVEMRPASGEIPAGGEQLIEVIGSGDGTLSTGRISATVDGSAFETLVTISPRRSEKSSVEAALQAFHFDGPPLTQLDPRSLFLFNSSDEAATVRLEYNQQWLFATPQSITIRPGESEEVTVSANTSGQSAGKQEGLISIQSTRGSSDPQVRQVVAKLDVSSSYAQTSIRPSGLLLYGNAGSRLVCRPLGRATASAAGCQIEILNFASEAVASDVTIGESQYFTVSGGGPASIGAKTQNGPGSRTIVLMPRELSADAKSGTQKILVKITVGNRTSVVDLHVLTIGSSNSQSRNAAAADCAPKGLNVLPIGANPELIVPAGATASLDFEVVDSCGEPLRDGTVLADFSSEDRGVALRPVGNGRWQTTWQPGAADGSRITIVARAWNRGATLRGEARLVAVVLGDSASPILNADGIRNYAGATRLDAIAPGSLISLKGVNLAARSASAGTQSWPVTLQDVSVLIGNRRAKIESVSPTEIKLEVPSEITPGTITDIVVQNSGRHSAPVAAPVAEASSQIPAVQGANVQ